MTSSLMDVVVCRQPGDLLVDRKPMPTPGDGEVLVRVKRVGVCGTDMHIYRGTQPYLSYPRVMGHEVSGVVAAAPASSRLRDGDPVAVVPYISCGGCKACRNEKPNCCMRLEVLGVHRDGAMAAYVSLPERFLVPAAGITLDEAAMIEFLSIGAHAVRRAGVRSGQRVIVSGVGPIGIACALFSRLSGADVVVVDTRPERLGLCRDTLAVTHALVFDQTLDTRLREITDGDMFDTVFDATGSAAAMQHAFRYAGHGGTYVLVSVVNADITFSDPEFHKRELTLLGSRNATKEDFEHVLGCMRQRKVPTRELHTHGASLLDVPAVFPTWLDSGARVIKALIEC
jgi:2-desacetyl-2-hydroxyethyl bacteriochlorophyllide A dehydrogenase